MAKVDYIKQVQTKVNRQIRLLNKDFGVSKQQCRDVYLVVVKDPENPTKEELVTVVERLELHFQTQSYSSELTIPEPEISEDLVEEIPKPATTEITPKDNPDTWETLQPASSEQPQQPQQEEAASLAITKNSSNLPTHQPEAAETVGITQTEIEQAVELAIAQTGAEGNTEAKQIISQLALHLKSDINTLEQAVTALVTGYLNKRSNILNNAMGTLNTLRNAQTNSFCSGLTPDFLTKQETAKKQLMEIANTFN